jgi:hypothetical protein
MRSRLSIDRVGEIERAAGVVHRNAVDEDLGVLALAAADEERRRAAVRAGLDERESRHGAQRIDGRGDALGAELITRDDGDRRGLAVRRDGRARRRDDDGRDARRIGYALLRARGEREQQCRGNQREHGEGSEFHRSNQG